MIIIAIIILIFGALCFSCALSDKVPFFVPVFGIICVWAGMISFLVAIALYVFKFVVVTLGY